MSTPGFASTSSLPDGWVVVRLADLVERLESGKRPKGGVRGIKEGVPSIGGEHLTPDGGFDFSSLRYVPEEFFDSLSKGRIAIGDILVVKDGATTGKVALVRSGFPLEPAAVNEHVFLLRPARGVSPHYLFWYLWSEAGQRAIRNQVRGAAQGGIVRAFADAVRVPLPPRAEQDRIVEAVEAAMAVIERAEVPLDSAGRLCRVLKGAITERLISGFPRVALGSVTDGLRYGTSTKCAYDASGEPVIRIPNVRDGAIDLSDLKRAVDSKLDLSSFSVAPGDLLFVRTNGSRDLIGRVARVGEGVHAAFASYLIRARPDPDRLDSRFAVLALSAPSMRAEIVAKAASTAGQYNLNLDALKSLEIPLPPIGEQQRVISEIEGVVRASEQAEHDLGRARAQARDLRNSILRRAFTGQLVPQDPTDEPASRLLERIQAEKAEREAAVKASKRAKQSTRSGGREGLVSVSRAAKG